MTYYKVPKGTQLFKDLKALQAKMSDAIDKARDIVSRLGCDNFVEAQRGIAGGISGIEMPNGCPEGWRDARLNLKNVYFPKINLKANKALLAEIEALPIVSENELTALLNYDWRKVCKGRLKSFYPHTNWRTKAVYIRVSDAATGYVPHDDMVEIVASEYNKGLESKA